MKKMIASLVLCIVSAAVSLPASAEAWPANAGATSGATNGPANGAASGPTSGAANGSARVERMMAQVQSRFAAANTTHDGKLTREQAQAGMPMVAQHFEEIDAQQAGFVTLAQIEDFMRARAAAR
ncbi:EF-hand domain-containing protein [Paraburkholderia sp. JHI2823]|uniref:EF-hand domain-containing protein n=1 Tax=Paraburkholderia sp. JHI2823 TaxID=3112960 RepID=UPI00317FBBF3